MFTTKTVSFSLLTQKRLLFFAQPESKPASQQAIHSAIFPLHNYNFNPFPFMDDKPADNKSSTAAAAFVEDLVPTFLVGEIGTVVDEVGPFDCANAACCCCFAATLACNAAASFSFRF
jgi:hypothetical protein